MMVLSSLQSHNNDYVGHKLSCWFNGVCITSGTKFYTQNAIAFLFKKRILF